MIKLNYTDMAFEEQELIDFIKASDSRNYIVQGQRVVTLGNHPKKKSFDVWLRKHFPKKRDTKLADNYVIEALLKTGKFIVTKEICPDSGRLCKSIRLV